MTIATFWAHLVALLRSSQARLQHWIPEREIRARKLRVYDRRTQRSIPVLPDAAFVVRYPDGFVQPCYLEVDMGTLTVRRFQQKLRAFEAEEGRWLTTDQRPVEFEVLVLTRSRRRLNQLWRASLADGPTSRLADYSFATVEVLDPEQFGAAHWLTLENHWVPVLYQEAFPERLPEGGTAQE